MSFALILAALSPTPTPAALAHVPEVYEIAPGGDWCDALKTQAGPGDHVALLPGEHAVPEGGCVIPQGGEAEGELLLLKAADPDDPPRIVGAPGALPHVRARTSSPRRARPRGRC